MTEFQTLLDRAYAEFDAMVAEQELQHRGRLRAAGWPKKQIDKAIDRCRPVLADQRAKIPALVHESIVAAGVPTRGSA